MKAFDIVSFGGVAVDDTYVVDSIPVPDSKRKYIATRRSGGGQSATGLVAAARLGCSCRWIGYLGDNELSSFTRQVFTTEGIAFTASVTHPEAGPVHSIIINARSDGSRTLFWNDDKVVPYAIDDDALAMIDAAKCLFMDQCTPEVQLLAARRAARHDVPIVSDIEHMTTEILREAMELADHFIIPLAVTPELFGEEKPAAALAKAIRFGRKSLVCITDGGRGSWFTTAESPDTVFHQPAFKVEPVVDTNGCGDVFHGTYAAALVKNFPPEERIKRATAAAALKVRAHGGQEGCPNVKELEDFLHRC